MFPESQLELQPPAQHRGRLASLSRAELSIAQPEQSSAALLGAVLPLRLVAGTPTSRSGPPWPGMATMNRSLSDSGGSFLGHLETREQSEWESMRRAKNRRTCTTIQEAMDAIKRQHELELRNHRHDAAMRRHQRELASAAEAKATRDAVKQRQVEEVMQKRAAQADNFERQLQDAQTRADDGMQERMDGMQRTFKARREREAGKAVRREEAVEVSVALRQQQLARFQESAEAKARRVRRQQRKNEQQAQQQANIVKRITSEKRSRAAEAKATTLVEAEHSRMERAEQETKRHALRVKQAAGLQYRRKHLERELWMDADNAKQGLAKFLSTGKADSTLLSAVQEAQDTELVRHTSNTD